MKTINDIVRFSLELCALAAFALLGWRITTGPVRLATAAVAVVVAATCWGIWMAPKSGMRLADPTRFAAESLFFLAAAGALAVSGRLSLALAFAPLALVNAMLDRALAA